MVLINMMNLAVCAAVLRRTRSPTPDPDFAYRRWMRVMGALFTAVGAYRSVFVCKYISQAAWFDSAANSALLIRGFALFAEVSFSGQIALAMLRVNRDLDLVPKGAASGFARLFIGRAPYVLWGAIVLAQVFATGGVITKSELSFAIEETLWSVGFVTALPLAILQYRRASSHEEGSGRLRLIRSFTRINLFWCAVYCLWGVCINLPLVVWPAALEQLRTGMPPIQHGLGAIWKAFFVVHESKAWGDWGLGFLFWHSSYFSLCVWISISMMRAPRALARVPVPPFPGSARPSVDDPHDGREA